MFTDTVHVGDISMRYFSFGEGERAFVILPGIDTKSVILSAKAVEAAYRDFGARYKVYCFDRRLDMPEGYTIRAMASDTAAVMRALSISGADIFAASQGGMIAMCLALDHPDLVHALVLGSTAACSDPAIEDGTAEWIRLAEARDMTALTEDFITRLYSPQTIGKYKDLLIHMNDNVTDEDIRRFIIQAKALCGYDIRPELPQISCPVLAIGCLGDKVLPARCSEEIARLTGGELYLYGEEFGHCVFDEVPDYKQRIMDFLTRV